MHTVLLQVLALDVILANGTRKIFTNETDPFLMKVRIPEDLQAYKTCALHRVAAA